ncbi:amidohydrolase family protein, partial [Amycolatopsis sp. H20-H5]|uniref:amidohydrolase family protein n=1 Tax=Amycolatopsis sp. H20-H5 TaxID=3046309 RepID=UPI002DD0A5CD|nr:amidohydrolase family protein [Amycolatopsis sp. H20-H5]
MHTVITAGQVLPRPATPIRDGAVLVSGGFITAVGPRAQVLAQAPVDAVHHDFPDGTVLAGMFNVHVHLAFDATRESVA